MGISIQTNLGALSAGRNLGINQNALNKSIERLSSGFRINRAADDAAGFAIAAKLSGQNARLMAASQNALQATSLVQMADSSANAIQNMLTRLQTLATQAASAQNASESGKLDTERQKLESQINKIANSTNFNGVNLLSGVKSSAAAFVGATTASSIINQQSAGTAFAKINTTSTTNNAAGTNFGAGALTGNLQNEATGTVGIVASSVVKGGAGTNTGTQFAGIFNSAVITVNENAGSITSIVSDKALQDVNGNALTIGGNAAVGNTNLITLGNITAINTALGTNFAAGGGGATDANTFTFNGTDSVFGHAQLATAAVGGGLTFSNAANFTVKVGTDGTVTSIKSDAALLGNLGQTLIAAGTEAIGTLGADSTAVGTALGITFTGTAAAIGGVSNGLSGQSTFSTNIGANFAAGQAQLTVGTGGALFSSAATLTVLTDATGAITSVKSNIALKDNVGGVIAAGGGVELLQGGTAALRTADVANLQTRLGITLSTTPGVGSTAGTSTVVTSGGTDFLGGAAQLTTVAVTTGSNANFSNNANFTVKTDSAGAIASITSDQDLLKSDGNALQVQGTNATKNTNLIGLGGASLAQVQTALNLTFTVTTAGASTAGTSTFAASGGTDFGAAVAQTALDFQVGSDNNANNVVQVDLSQKFTTTGGAKSLQISGDLTSTANAKTYIDTIKAALNNLATKRATLGATQNQLGFVNDSLATSIEQVSSAISIIKDANLATETANFAKNQILVQAGTSMLAQANTAAQNVLRLFR